MQKNHVITADAAAAATLRVTLVPNTNLSLKLAASVRLSLARTSPSAIYGLTSKRDRGWPQKNELQTPEGTNI